MAKVSSILCQVITGNVDNAGTDGRVYLGLGGREYRLDSSEDDYERGSWREYMLGRGLGAQPKVPPPPPQILVENKEFNDPRFGLPLDTVYLTSSPVYIRFEPSGSSPNWNLTWAAALVYVGASEFVTAYIPPAGFDNLWLGDPTGKMLFLTDYSSRGETIIFDLGRQVAAKQEKASAS